MLGTHIAKYGATDIDKSMVVLRSVLDILEKKPKRTETDDDSTSPQIKNKCKICAADASTSCAGCTNVVCLLNTDHTRTYYCSKDCQTQDWLQHKDSCKKIKAQIEDQSVINAAQFLTNAFYLYRLAAYDISVKSAAWKDTDLVVHEGDYDKSYENGGRVVDIPLDIMRDASGDTNKMLLSTYACDDLLGHLHHLIKLIMLEPKIVKKIEEIEVDPKPGPKTWTLHRPQKTKTPVETSADAPHHIWRLITMSGKKWALDISAAQYGYKQNLMPWPQYISERVHKVNKIRTFGSIQESNYATIMSFQSSAPIVATQRRVGKIITGAIRGLFKHKRGTLLSVEKVLCSLPAAEFRYEASKVLMGALKAIEAMRLDVLKLGWNEYMFSFVREEEMLSEIYGGYYSSLMETKYRGYPLSYREDVNEAALKEWDEGDDE